MVYWHRMYMVAQKWKNRDIVRKYWIRRVLESSKANTKCNSSISGSKGLDGSAFQLCGQQYSSFSWADYVPCTQLSFFRYPTTQASLTLLGLYWKSGYAFTSSTMASHNLLPSQMLHCASVAIWIHVGKKNPWPVHSQILHLSKASITWRISLSLTTSLKRIILHCPITLAV